MEENFSCALCFQTAEHCCLCDENRVYLCKQCLPTHTSSGLIHPIAPTSTPLSVTANTLNLYLEKREATEKYFNAMEILKNRLENEKQSASEFIDQTFTEQYQLLDGIYANLKSNVVNFYDKSITEVTALQAEINQWVQGLRIPSEECLAVIRSGCHYRTDCEVLLKSSYDIRPLQVGNASIPLDNHISSILEAGGFGCNCPDCIATAMKMLPSWAWMCQQCGSGPNTGQQCYQCSLYVIETQAAETQHCPTCYSPFDPNAGCAYCQSILLPQPGTEQQPMPTAQYPLVQGRGLTWKCAICNNSENSEMMKICKQCGAKKTTSKSLWRCWECGELNSYDLFRCLKCDTSREWVDFLLSKGVKLNEDKSMWVCKRCRDKTPVTVGVCQSCKKKNSAIIRGRKGIGETVSFIGKVKGFIDFIFY